MGLFNFGDQGIPLILIFRGYRQCIRLSEIESHVNDPLVFVSPGYPGYIRECVLFPVRGDNLQGHKPGRVMYHPFTGIYPRS